MGDPRRRRRIFSRPSHPWQKVRLDDEAKLKKEYGLKNKKEIWRSQSKLNKVQDQSKDLILETGSQGQKLQSQLISRLANEGLIPENATLDDVLSLGIKDFLERRLQTILVRKGIAKTMRQSRQMIAHGHIKVGEKKMTVPSYIVTMKEEPQVTFSDNSSFSKPGHPETGAPAVPAEETE